MLCIHQGEEPTGPTKVFALECMEGILLKVRTRRYFRVSSSLFVVIVDEYLSHCDTSRCRPEAPRTTGMRPTPRRPPLIGPPTSCNR
jgi:hypothetical protein